MKTWLMLLLIAIIAGCDNDDNATIDLCPTPENLEHFPWVIELVDNLGKCSACTTSVVRGTYRGKTVVFTLMNDPSCNGIFIGPLYDCNGQFVRYFSSSDIDQQEFSNRVSANMILGRCEDYSIGNFGGFGTLGG